MKTLDQIIDEVGKPEWATDGENPLAYINKDSIRAIAAAVVRELVGSDPDDYFTGRETLRRVKEMGIEV